MTAVTEALVHARTAPLVIGYGAGVNSLAALIACKRRGIAVDLVMFADTGGEASDGGELPETYDHLNRVAIPWMVANGFPFLRVWNRSPVAGHASLEANCLANRTLPSRAFGRSSCADRWKIEPQEKYLTHWQPSVDAWSRGQKTIKILGYDGGETGRADIHEDKRFLYWHPLIEFAIDRDGCVSLIEDEGLEVPPGSACFYCPSSTKAEVLELSRRKPPTLFNRAVAMERRALADTEHPMVNVKGLGRHWSWEELAAADEEKRAKMLENPVERCTQCVG